MNFVQFFSKYKSMDALSPKAIEILWMSNAEVIFWATEIRYTGPVIARIINLDNYMCDVFLEATRTRDGYLKGDIFTEPSNKYSIWLYKEDISNCECGADKTSNKKWHYNWCKAYIKGT